MLGRRLRNVLPLAPPMLTQDAANILTATERSDLLEKSYASSEKRLNEGTRLMETLAPGILVRVQNQTGHYPRRWQGTGTVTEVLPFKQYTIKMDGTGKSTTRNRQFIFPVVSPWKN